MSARPPLAIRKVRSDDAQLPVTKDGSPASLYRPTRRWKHWKKAHSLLRLAFVVALTVLAILTLRHRFARTASDRDEAANAAAKDAVLGNCMYLEPLRRSYDCYEISGVKGAYQGTHHAAEADEPHQHDDLGIKTSFGAVLDYKAGYDAFVAAPTEARFTRHWILKCFVGFGMSLVWDFEFRTDLAQAYLQDSKPFPAVPGREKDAAAAAAAAAPSKCPRPDAESSASMVLSINCDRDIQRDKWGRPARDEDRETLETCTRMAYTWIRGREGFANVKPWGDLCEANADGTYGRCDRNVFQLEDRGIKPPTSRL